MSILNRLWPREEPTANSDPALAQRLNELTGKDETDSSKPKSAASSQRAAASTASAPEKAIEAPAADVSSAGAGQAARRQQTNTAPRNSTSAIFTEQDGSQAVSSSSRVEERTGEAQENGMENRRSESAQTPTKDKPEDTPEAAASSSSASGPGRQFMERFHAAVDRADGAEKSPASGSEAPPDFQSIQKQFEADFRKRLDGALAEFERRVSSQALVDDISGQIEQRIRVVADGIFKEVKSQAWMMHSAVAGELRSFRDQFAKEIEERVGMLDRAAQHALQVKEKLEETLPKAEDTLRSLSASGQEAAARFQAASKVFADELRLSHEELSRDVEAQKESWQALAQGMRHDGEQLQAQMEKFRDEAAAAINVLGRTSDQSLEKIAAAADEVSARGRDGIEKLATEIERRILSGGLVEKATERLAKSTQELVEPALERIRKASQAADTAAESLASAGQHVSEQLDSARQQIQARLDGLLSEQLNLLEGAMSGFQRKASEELGDLVERVVAQSTSQMDERLHSMLQDLFATTTKQINTAARATLSNMHEGLKEAFKTEAFDPATDSASIPAAG
jgi:hypothetical protein